MERTRALNSVSDFLGKVSTIGATLPRKNGSVAVSACNLTLLRPCKITFIVLSGNSRILMTSATVPSVCKSSNCGSSIPLLFWQKAAMGICFFCAVRIAASDFSRPTDTGIVMPGNITKLRKAKTGTSSSSSNSTELMSLLVFISAKIGIMCGAPSLAFSSISLKKSNIFCPKNLLRILSMQIRCQS